MATQTGKTRTITGFIADLLEYPRWVFEREVDFTNCRHGGHYNEFIDECRECHFGAACRWLDQNRTPSLENASVEELTNALDSAVRYLRTTHKHKKNCVCKTCHWLREARHFRRSHLKST
jgi:hypothetical protein